MEMFCCLCGFGYKVKQSALPRIQCDVVKAKVLLSVLSVVKVSGGGRTCGKVAGSGRLIARWEWEHVQKEWLGMGD